MSQRYCDHSNCGTPQHLSIKVGQPGQPAVWVHLCRHHENTDDGTLVLLAKAKANRRPFAGEIETPANGLLVARKSDGGLAQVTSVTDYGVQLQHSGGTHTGMSHQFLKKHYGLPAALKRGEPETQP